jgi:hypothetical protein
MSIKKRVKRLEKYFQQQDEPPKALMDFRWSGPQPGGDCVAFQIVDKCGDVTRIDCLPDESMDEVWPIAQAVAVAACGMFRGRARRLPTVETYFPPEQVQAVRPEQVQAVRPEQVQAVRPRPEPSHHEKRLRELGSFHVVSTF